MVRFLEWPFIYFSEATVEDRVTGTSCLKESEIEDLARGKLSGEVERRCLAHLLWCQSCQQKVDEETEFARATRSAAVVLERKAAGQWQGTGWFQRIFDQVRDRVRDWFCDSFRAPVRTRWMAVALSVCVLTAVAVLLPLRRNPEGELVVLRSERGSAVPATVEGSAGANLRLRIDVSDVAPSPAYSVTVVDALGQTIETSAVSATGGTANVTLHRQLPPGGYWVRLCAPDGRLLREYALRVR
jgi:hypothetical protein